MNFDDISPEQEKNIREKLNNWAEKNKLPAEKSLRLKQMVKDLATQEKRNHLFWFPHRRWLNYATKAKNTLQILPEKLS